MKNPTAERRAHARFPKTVDLEGTAAESGTTARMVASDLSLGGLYCTSTSDYPEMTRLSVRLNLPGEGERNGPLQLDAVVVREQKLDSSTGNSRYELALFFMGMTDLLLGTDLTPEQREYAEIIRRSGEGLLTVINDILEYSKIEARKLELETVDFDLRRTLEDAADVVTNAATKKGLALHCLHKLT